MPKEKNYFRIFIILISVVTITIIIWNTFVFFNQLKENERVKVEILAEAYSVMLSNEDLGSNVAQLALEIVKRNTTTPMILYTYETKDYDHINIPDEKINTDTKKEYLIEKFKTQYKPIDVVFEDETFSTIYYGNSDLIKKIKYYPVIIVLIILLFVGLVYFFLKTRKTSDQNRLWAGMAKETAHQIGTPLSSLVGWTEILKSENVNEEYIVEMEKDIFRLQNITDRFSKIGSVPHLIKKDVVAETIQAVDYLKARSSKLITFETKIPNEVINVMLNKQLYGWAIENMVKNAIDAMKGQGEVTIEIIKNTRFVYILISDSGKGIPKNQFQKIFAPGFTTKTRGWGLGLSLTRRIIEDYHQGRIRVKSSEIDKGTCFQISLKIEE